MTAPIDETIAAALITEPRLRIADARELKQRMDAAWHEHGIAGADEVGRWVERLAGEPLRERRQKVAAARANPSDTHADGEPTLPMVAPSSSATPASTEAAHAGRSRGGRVVAGAIALALVGAAALVSFRGPSEGSSEAPPAVEAAAPVTAAPAEASALPAETATAPPAPSEERPPTPVLRITANAPIQQLRVGRRSIVLPDPVAEIEVPLSQEEQNGAFDLIAVARGGRRTTTRIEAGQRATALEFGPAPAPATQRRPRTSKPSSDRLADSPYGGR